MEEINLEKYKSAWKKEQMFFEEKLSSDQILKFMQSLSKSIGGLFRISLTIDIVLKVLLTLSFCVLFVLYSNQIRIQIIDAVFIFLTILCIAFQISVYKKIPNIKNANQNSKSLLYSYIDFYKNKFIFSLTITSLTSSLFFISGALYYFYYKYKTIRFFQYDDYLVFGTIILISFLLSAFIQIKNFNFHIHQVQKNLVEIEQDSINESNLKQYKKLNNRNLILFSIILFIGLLLLILFLFHI